MKRLINASHLFLSERLAGCSDEAQIQYGRLMLSSNTACRSELSPAGIRNAAYPTIRKPYTDDEINSWLREYRDHHLLFIYVDPATGSLWGEWLVPDEFKPSYTRAEDRDSPAPDPKAIEAYRRSYYDEKRRKLQKAINISELSESVPISANSSHFRKNSKSYEQVRTTPTVLNKSHSSEQLRTLSTKSDSSSSSSSSTSSKEEVLTAVVRAHKNAPNSKERKTSQPRKEMRDQIDAARQP